MIVRRDEKGLMGVQRAKAEIYQAWAKPWLVILRVRDWRLQVYLYVSDSFLLQSGWLASRRGLAWTFDFERPSSCETQPGTHACDFDNSDCMSRSHVIFPGIDLGYGSPPQNAWTFFKPPHL
jgi:hypothetical protein